MSLRLLWVVSFIVVGISAQVSAVTLDWVTIGQPGNACGRPSPEAPLDFCFGAVEKSFRIARHEVTNLQYAGFLNAVAAETDPYYLYNPLMDSADPLAVEASQVEGGITRSGTPGAFTYTAVPGRENKPVVFVSFFDSLRFANWLHNGQPSGLQDATTTEDGAYPFSGITGVGARNPDAIAFLPTLDEWYKAAYFDPLSMSYNPYPFADGFDGVACEGAPGTTSHSAACDAGGASGARLSDVGSYADSPSAYGTFDQGGNVWEWNERIITGGNRGIEGGSWDLPGNILAASSGGADFPLIEDFNLGFRVASIVPEPTTALLLGAGLAALAVRRRSLH